MNLRIDSHQLRFRFSQDDIAQLQQNGQIIEAMPTTWLRLRHLIALIDETVATLTVSGNDENLTLHIPKPLAEELALNKPSKEGISFTQTDDTGKQFEVVVEVDVRKLR